MPNLRISTAHGEERLSMAAGLSVRDALDTTALRVRAACGGTGACGACRVRLLEGQANPCTGAEFQKLTAEERAAGWRLACQLRPAGDATLRLDDPAPPSPWRSLPPEALYPTPGSQPHLSRHRYGLAVDLGTTHIRVTLWDRKRGRRLASRHGPNPQGVFGADVLNRLAAAARPERAAELAAGVREAILGALYDMLARDLGEVAPMLPRIGRVVVVGNSAMLALLTGEGAAVLLEPEGWQRPVDYRPRDPAAWQAGWSLPNAEITLPPPVAGFIGSDLAADLLAVGLTEGAAGALLLDLGTNTEIALWDGARLRVTSVPGGPAFEGVGVRFGMPAEPGAIWRVRPAAEGFACDTVAGAPARGFCGSGLVDAVAALLAAGRLKPSGRFAAPPGSDGLRLDPGNPRSALTGGDIDLFQRAKAATAAAVALLLGRAGLGVGDLRRICLCGAFGRTLAIASAQAIGLLPPIDPARVELAADAALAGCERALLLAEGEAQLAALAGRAEAVNLAGVEAYDETYIDHLRLAPFPPPR